MGKKFVVCVTFAKPSLWNCRRNQPGKSARRENCVSRICLIIFRVLSLKCTVVRKRKLFAVAFRSGNLYVKHGISYFTALEDTKIAVAAAEFFLSNAVRYEVNPEVFSNELQQLGFPKGTAHLALF